MSINNRYYKSQMTIPPFGLPDLGRAPGTITYVQPTFDDIGRPLGPKWSTRLDGGCPACVAKHLSQAILSFESEPNCSRPEPSDHVILLCRAIILDREAASGYTGHQWLAAGCIAEAETLLLQNDPAIAKLRDVRLRYVSGSEQRGSLRQGIESAFGKVDDPWAFGWAHVREASAELPASDAENRGILSNLPAERRVQEISRCLKNVVELYSMEA